MRPAQTLNKNKKTVLPKMRTPNPGTVLGLPLQALVKAGYTLKAAQALLKK